MEMTVTLVYAKCDRIERIELWDSLYNLASDMNTPWLVGGDFNVITDEHEKYGGQPVSLNEVEDFRHCINTCNLTDLGYKGSVYTWWNGRGVGNCIFKRLDRCLGNFEFQQLFPGLEITHLIKNGSDHSPLLLECKEKAVQIRKSFRFLNFWVKHETFLDVVRANWNTDVPANSFMSFNLKLKKMKKVLSQWSRATYGDIFQEVTNLEEVIKAHEQRKRIHLYSIEKSCRSLEEFRILKELSLKQMKKLLKRVDLMDTQACFSKNVGISLEMIYSIWYGISLENPQTFSEMRPISLSNFVNKVFSRVIHERMVHLLPKLISQNQAGFVRGKSIVENILLTQEIITDIGSELIKERRMEVK
ncbi:uncharacterized protein LOC132061351 [Lycium ferocissimum]|uniref:uncharacterized protein LOC132061351 n=1 Tax=Lycium ferocissimum TaxID=112874 RepID=UPI0028163216|nr:uncharacterized protein LOC132061351 [Lycium ferocissimum]